MYITVHPRLHLAMDMASFELQTPVRAHRDYKALDCLETPSKITNLTATKVMQADTLQKAKTAEMKPCPDQKKRKGSNLMTLASKVMPVQKHKSTFKGRYLSQREIIHGWW